MRGRIQVALLLLAALAARAEIIDRIAVSVDNIVITMSEISQQIRVAAFIDGQPLNLDTAARRAAADRLIELALIRREMQVSRHPLPEQAAVEAVLGDLKKSRFNLDDEKYRRALADYGVSDAELRQAIQQQLATLRFIDFRFRPGIQVSADEIQEYYRNEFLRKWREASREPPPPLAEVRGKVEGILVEQRVDQALDRWISQARTQTRILFREEAFR